MKSIKAYKLFRTLKNKSGIYPLFIGSKNKTEIGQWITAKNIPTPGYAQRPGWHAGMLPIAPHLRSKEGFKLSNRVWAEVEISADINWQEIADASKTKDMRNAIPESGYYYFKTSKMQGGMWIIGGAIKVNKILTNSDIMEILTNAGLEEQAKYESTN